MDNNPFFSGGGGQCRLPFVVKGDYCTVGCIWITYGIKKIEYDDPGYAEVFTGGSPISIFLSGYFMLCVVAYFSKKKDVKNNLKFVIWLSAVYFMLLFTFARCNPYWMVLYLPFIIMVVIEHKENLKVNILIESAMEVVVILIQGIVYSWIYFSGNIFSSLLLKPADIEMAWQRNLVNFLGVGDEGISLCLIVANTIFFACEIVLLITCGNLVYVKVQKKNLY